MEVVNAPGSKDWQRDRYACLIVLIYKAITQQTRNDRERRGADKQAASTKIVDVATRHKS